MRCGFSNYPSTCVRRQDPQVQKQENNDFHRDCNPITPFLELLVRSANVSLPRFFSSLSPLHTDRLARYSALHTPHFLTASNLHWLWQWSPCFSLTGTRCGFFLTYSSDRGKLGSGDSQYHLDDIQEDANNKPYF